MTTGTTAQPTLQRALRQVELCDIVAELADVTRQREARIVAAKVDGAALRLHADDRERQLACARDSLFIFFRTRRRAG